MKTSMNIIDRQFQKGSGFMVLLGVVLTLFFTAYAIIEPEQKYFSLFLTLIGLTGTWRQYVVWSRKRKQHGLELIGTDPQNDQSEGKAV